MSTFAKQNISTETQSPNIKRPAKIHGVDRICLSRFENSPIAWQARIVFQMPYLSAIFPDRKLPIAVPIGPKTVKAVIIFITFPSVFSVDSHPNF